MNKKLKSFTLVEMLIVLAIVFIMFNALKTVLSFSQKDFINSQTCANKASARIIWQLNNALTSKILFHNNNRYSPNSYWVDVFSTGIVWFAYSGSQKIIFPDYSLQLSWNDVNISNECYSKNYRVIASWNIKSIEIKKWLSFDQKNVFVINSWANSLLTWEVKFLQCVWNQVSNCRDLSKINADQRSLSIVQTKCTKWNWNRCVSVGY